MRLFCKGEAKALAWSPGSFLLEEKKAPELVFLPNL